MTMVLYAQNEKRRCPRNDRVLRIFHRRLYILRDVTYEDKKNLPRGIGKVILGLFASG